MNVIPLEALFDERLGPNSEIDAQGILDNAEVIMGIDVMSRNMFLVFGRTLLERIVSSGESREVKFLGIEIDQETDELEKLLALMLTVKGLHDYQPSVV